MKQKLISLGLIYFLIISGVSGFFHLSSYEVSAYISHSAIVISGDDDFISDNGVVSGNGSSSSPYIISNWEIYTTTNTAISVKSTDLYFEIRNVYIHSDSYAAYNGIELRSVTHGLIRDSKISARDSGIYLKYANGVTIRNNEIKTNTGAGISVEYSKDNLIEDNRITESNDGIFLGYKSIDNTIDTNYISDCEDQGIHISSKGTFSTTNMTYGQRIINNSISNTAHGIYCEGGHNNSIRSNVIEDNNVGIYLFSNSNDNIVDMNDINSNLGAAFYAETSSNNVVTNNEILLNGGGIYIDQLVYLKTIVSGNTINYNVIKYNSGSGISLTRSVDNILIGNQISFNGYGIDLMQSSGNRFVDNDISYSKEEGINIGEGSDDNIIDKCKSSGNKMGVHIAYSKNIILTRSVITSNTEYGIRVIATSYDTFTGNIIEGNGKTGILLYSSASYMLIKNNEISNNSEYGIECWESEDLNMRYSIIEGNNITSNLMHGMYLWPISMSKLINNKVTKNKWGILLIDGANNNTIKGNVISETTSGISISRGSNDNILTENHISNSDNAVSIQVRIKRVIFNNNTVDNSEYGISISADHISDLKDNIIRNNEYGLILWNTEEINVNNNLVENNNAGLRFYNCSNLNMKNNSIIANGIGIDLRDSNEILITGSNFSGNEIGVSISGSSDIDIADNDLNDNDIGSLITESSEIGIEANTITLSGKGISLDRSDNDLITRNTFTDNDLSIELAGSDDNKIKNNLVHNNEQGLDLFQSNGNIISANNITNNTLGLKINSSNTNLIYHNNFIDNLLQVSIISGGNLWNIEYPAGGNYWSDHSGFDNASGMDQDESGCDGIGDEPYLLFRSGGDTYPFMRPFESQLPYPPQNVEVIEGNGYVFLRWEVHCFEIELPASTYRIYRSNSSSLEVLFDEVGDLLYYNDTEVTNGITYYYQITSVNGEGESLRTGEIIATPHNRPPEVSIQPNKTGGNEPLTIKFNGSADDRDGTVVSYFWDFGDGTNSTMPYPVHTFNGSGTFVVRLIATDNEGANTTLEYVINVIPPVPPPNPKKHIRNQLLSDEALIIIASIIVGFVALMILLIAIIRSGSIQEEYGQVPHKDGMVQWDDAEHEK